MKFLVALVLCASFVAPVYAVQVAYAVRSTEIKLLPFSDAKTVATLDEKAKVNILLRQGGWIKINSVNGNGWVRMLSLRSENVAKKSGDSGLQSLLNVGRTGSSGITTTTGIRGLSEEDLKNAQPNPEEFTKLQKYSVNKVKAEQFARDANLNSQQIEYLSSSDKP
jgi:hypothetical protein